MLCDSTLKLRHSFQQHLCITLKNFRKHFATLHNQDRKIFCFPNTAFESLILPGEMNYCQSLDDFKIKALKGGFKRRPELIANYNADLHFNSSQIKIKHRIQEELVKKAVSLAQDIKFTFDFSIASESVIKNGSQLILDIGCGDGTSTLPLLEMGYSCIGVDVSLRSLSQLKKYLQSGQHVSYDGASGTHNVKHNFHIKYEFVNKYWNTNNVPLIGDIVRWDLRYGLPFRAHTFDMVVSISFLQWLFSGEWQKQLDLFFSSLKLVLLPKKTAVIQFYPSSSNQLEEAVKMSMKYFQGVVVGDYPHVNRGRKIFLILFS